MTENEAINEIHRLCCNESQWYQKVERNCKDNCIYGENYCAFQIAIKALEEVREYRKLGTVEEVGEAVEKTKAKKCIQDSCHDHTRYKCPSCGKIQMSEYKRGIRILGRIPNNCDNCGQRLESEE